MDEDLECNGKIAKAFTIEQAKELISFIEKNRNKASCIIHCAAGISRSGAVGQFINDFYGGIDFKETNRIIRPNNHVFRTLKQCFMQL